MRRERLTIMEKLNGVNKEHCLQIFSFLIIFLLYFELHAQVLTQDAKGNSTVLYNGGTIGFNIQESALGFCYNNFSNERIEDSSKHIVFGINLSAKNIDGISNLLEDGKLTPEAKGNLFLGYSFTIGNSIKEKMINNSLNILSKELYNMSTNFQFNLKHKIKKLAKELIDNEELVGKINFLIKSKSYNNLEEEFNSLIEDNIDYKNAICSIRDTAISNVNFYIARKNESSNLKETLKNELTNFRNRYWIKRFTIYANIGLSARSFKYLVNIDTNNFSNSFENKYFNGANLNIGANLQWGGRYIFGLKFGFQKIDNFYLLTKSDFALKSFYSNIHQELTSNKTITAFSGLYETLYEYNIDADIIRFIPLGESNVLLINPYIRHCISNNSKIIPNITNIGISTFLFKNNGSFLGGLYVEAPDVFNNIEKSKTQPILKPIYSRLSFGIIGKLVISSIISY